MSPPHPIFFKASHWLSDHMISSRPLIGQPSPPIPPGVSCMRDIFCFIVLILVTDANTETDTDTDSVITND